MPHSEPIVDISDADTILLNTAIGQLRARLESCSPRSDGETDVSILKCLGIQYATIPYRWAAPRKTAGFDAGIRDCTAFGPQCPQAREVLFDNDELPVFGRIGKNSFAVQADTEDEFSCLNLNIYAPLDVVSDGDAETRSLLTNKKLPVLVWVYGGASWTGTANVDLYDGAELVARSVRIGEPVILVTINYRLGVLGCLHSEQLARDAARQGDVPPHFRSTANLALLDTYVAFEWIKDNISAFGGDSESLTGIGESAGAVLLSFLSLSPKLHLNIPRMIFSSSTIFSNHILLPPEAQSIFDAVCRNAGIETTAGSSTGAVDALRALPVEDLIAISNGARSAYRPIWDDITISSDPRQVLHEPSLWDPQLEAVVFGHCENESWIRLASMGGDAPDLAATVVARIPPAPANLRSRALALYDPSPRGPLHSMMGWFAPPPGGIHQMSDAALAWMTLESHSRYYAVTQLLAHNFLSAPLTPQAGKRRRRRTVYRYILSWTPKPWPAGWPATHTADILPIFLHRRLSAEDAAVAAKGLTDELIRFTAGAAGRVVPMAWSKFEPEAPLFNVVRRDGSLATCREGSGEFSLTDSCIDLWRDVVMASLETGREGWKGYKK